MSFAAVNRVRGCNRRAPLLARLLIVLVALFHGWGSYASVVSSSHDPIFRSHGGGAPLAALSSGHDHGHDESATEYGDSESSSGHDAADHSHDKPDLRRSDGCAVVTPADDWGVAHHVPPYPAPMFEFDRPPKSLPMR